MKFTVENPRIKMILKKESSIPLPPLILPPRLYYADAYSFKLFEWKNNFLPVLISVLIIIDDWEILITDVTKMFFKLVLLQTLFFKRQQMI